MNFPKTVVTWENSEEGFLVPLVAGHREGESTGGKQDRLQARKVMDLAMKYGMIQQVDRPTHAINILDLIFCSDTDVVTSVDVENFPLVSDHKLVTAYVSYTKDREEKQLEELHLTNSGRRLKMLNMNKADWSSIQSDLEMIDWSEMETLTRVSTTAAYHWFSENHGYPYFH